MSNSSCSSNDSVAVLLPYKKPCTEARARSMARAQAVIKAEKEREMASLSALVDTLTEQFSTSLSLTDTSSAGRKCTGTTRQGTPCSKNASKGQLTCQHHRASMSAPTAPVLASTAAKLLKTEDTGKIFEMAICLAYGIPYNGPYKYSMERAESLKSRLSKLLDLFPKCYHTAAKGARYDFTCIDDESNHLSAKSTKQGVGKVAPQVIGQSQPQKFCDIIGTPYTTILALKQFIQTDIATILPILVSYTFDCPTVFYNQERNTIRYITLTTPIEWTTCQFKWTCDWNDWNNSSTLKMVVGEDEIALLEVQFHTKSRTNMAVRWYYETFLTLFKKNLTIIDF